MKQGRKSDWLFHMYLVIFLIYLLGPLIIMGGAAFNDSRFPSIYPWNGWTSRWFVELWSDSRMWTAFRNTLLIALAVVAISLPIGTAAAILINSLGGGARSVLYGLMVAPILTPGAVIGISTLLFWNTFGVPAGLHLSVLGQVSFVSSFVMLLVLARLQSFDRGL
jgi:spermidine/putrescine transport system permease protein